MRTVQILATFGKKVVGYWMSKRGNEYLEVAPMTPAQIEAVKNSWSKVTPIADQASVLFYERLFTLDPSLRALFKPDMTEQRKLLMTMLGTAVAGLDRLDTIVRAIQALGRRHKGYGVTEANYGTVGQALLWTLEQGLGEAFTPDVREAWTATFVLVSGTMKTAAARAA